MPVLKEIIQPTLLFCFLITKFHAVHLQDFSLATTARTRTIPNLMELDFERSNMKPTRLTEFAGENYNNKEDEMYNQLRK